MRKYFVHSFLSLLVLAGCGDTRDPKTQFISEGSGQSSSLPLQTLTAGALRVYDGDNVVARVLGPGSAFDHSVIRAQNGDNMRFYNAGKEGIYYEGSQAIGLLPRPELILPAQVRLGMKWHAYQDSEDPAREYEVVGYELSTSNNRDVPLWRIETRELSGSKAIYETTFAEGIGPQRVDENQLLHAIVPRQPAGSDTPMEARLVLQDGKEIMSEFWGQFVTGVVLPSSEMTVRIAGKIPAFTNDGYNARWGLDTRMLCLREDGSIDGAEPQTCRDAMSSLVHEGQLKGPEVGPFGEAARDGWTPVVNTRNEYEHLAIPKDEFFQPNFTLGDPASVLVGSGRIRGGDLTASWSGAGALRRMLMTQAGPTDTPSFVMWTSLGMLLHGAIDQNGFRPVSLIGSTSSMLTGVLEGSERTILFVSPDGAVDRLIIEDKSARLVRYARLSVPAGYEVAGVIPRRDALLVYATKGRNPLLLRTRGKPEVGSLYLFRVALTTLSADAVPSSDLVVNQADRDFEVCSRPGTHSSEAGWMLDDRPVAAITSRPDGSCVLLLRDAADNDGKRYIDGPLGSMDMSFNNTVVPADFVYFEKWAPVQGGFIAVDKRYSAAGIPYGPPAGGRFGGDGGPGLRTPDPFGHGMWWLRSQNPNEVVVHFGPNKTHETVVPAGGLFKGYIEGGGIIREDSTGTKLYHPDDRVISVDTTGLPGPILGVLKDGTQCGFAPVNSKLWCRDLDGTVRISSAVATLDEAQAWAGSGWVPLGNGRFFRSIAGMRTDILGQIFDPRTLSRSDVFNAPLTQLYPGLYFGGTKHRWSPSGELFLYMATSLNGEPRAIVRVTPDGIVQPVPLPGIEPSELRDFVVGDKMLIVATPRGLIRVKR